MEKIDGTNWIKDFYLAGGTALALQLGHRQSIDFDFFSQTKFSQTKILDSLYEITKKTAEIKEQDDGTLILFIENIKLSFFFYKHPLLNDTIKILNNIYLAGLKDIFAMKLIAISQRGTKKDFIDLYFLLQNGFKIQDTVTVLNEKYSHVKFNKLHILKSLLFFDDAENELDPIMIKDFSWKDVKEFIEINSKNFLKTLIEQ